MSRRWVIAWIVAAAALIAAVGVGALVLVRNSRPPQIHLIPDGYRGWVTASYGVEGAPPLPVEDGYRVFRYDENGLLETSSKYEEGWGIDDYFYVSDDGRKLLRQRPPGMEGEIWGAYTRTSQIVIVDGERIRKGVSTGFFVGTEEECQADPIFRFDAQTHTIEIKPNR